MQRRTYNVSGWVNFPINNPEWENTGEGGMLVKLVVIDQAPYETEFAMCCGAYVTDMLSESFIGDDQRPQIPAPTEYTCVEDILKEQADYEKWKAYHFPQINDDAANPEARYQSRPYLASIVLGSAGWSGTHDEYGYWQCGLNDLTDDGRNLYRQIKALYPTGKLHLLTFLDT